MKLKRNQLQYGLPLMQALENMRQGMTPTAAAEDAVNRFLELFPQFQGALVTMNSKGSHGAAAVGWIFHYTVAKSSAIPEESIRRTYTRLT
jgi:isoaspartyl peptidase/L-asparaginase-like protein (Ntn-hydrolase superfamily)